MSENRVDDGPEGVWDRGFTLIFLGGAGGGMLGILGIALIVLPARGFGTVGGVVCAALLGGSIGFVPGLVARWILDSRWTGPAVAFVSGAAVIAYCTYLLGVA
jgi:hypothetical protein